MPDETTSPPRPRVAWWAAALVAALFLAPRLWRFEAVGEGRDEAFSVDTTRVMAEGRFSYREMDDFRHDAYAAKFEPITEALAVPFVLVLGDRPLAFRLPSLLLSAAALALLARHVGRRHGRAAVLALLALALLDYRGVYYAQTHRYVAAEQALGVAFWLLCDRAVRRGGLLPWAAVAATGLVLLHTHLTTSLVVVACLGAAGWAALRGAGAGEASPPAPAGPPRGRFAGVVVLGLLAAYGTAMLALFLRAGHRAAYFVPADSFAALAKASVLNAGRTLLGLGPVAGPLGLAGAVLLVRRHGFAERAAGIACLATLALWLPAGTRANMQPRYALCVQPFFLVAAAVAAGRVLERLAARPAWRVAALAALALPSAATTGWYLATGGGRDAEVPIHEALRARAAAGDAVLWDLPLEDPFHRRPAGFRAVPRDAAKSADGARAFDGPGGAWVVASSREPRGAMWTPAFEARLEAVASTSPPQALQEPYEITLYRVRK